MPFRPMMPATRRDFLIRSAGGFGAAALPGMLAGPPAAAAADAAKGAGTNPLAARPPHFRPRAKRVIFLFMHGGPSAIDTFEYKPLLAKLDGKPIPDEFANKPEKVGGVFKNATKQIMAGPWEWKQRGRCGQWVSDLLPHTAGRVDDLCLIKTIRADSSNHAPASYQMNTGVILGGKPSIGSWSTYGLGSENNDLPGYVVLFKVAPYGGTGNWGNGFLPAAYQGTPFRPEGSPVLDLEPPAQFAPVQRSTLDFLQTLNRAHRHARPGADDLDGRIAAYELGYRMQSAALDVGDLKGEPPETLSLYGTDSADRPTAAFARMCLTARRLSERGVRFVQIFSGADKIGWDGHADLAGNHRFNARMTDQPIAALLTDLKRRGLWDDTLVVWAGEFGRAPMKEGNGGRQHNPFAFTVWLAGGGVKGGQALGVTDELGLHPVESSFTVKDLHATILHALGLDHEKLSFEHNGRPERLTGVAGTAKPISAVFA